MALVITAPKSQLRYATQRLAAKRYKTLFK